MWFLFKAKGRKHYFPVVFLNFLYSSPVFNNFLTFYGIRIKLFTNNYIKKQTKKKKLNKIKNENIFNDNSNGLWLKCWNVYWVFILIIFSKNSISSSNSKRKKKYYRFKSFTIKCKFFLFSFCFFTFIFSYNINFIYFFIFVYFFFLILYK